MRQRRDSLGCFTDKDGHNRGVRRWLHKSYEEYLESRIKMAEECCKAIFVNAAGAKQGINGYRLLDHRNRLSGRWRSEELNSWLNENTILTFTQYRDQVLEDANLS